MSGNLCILDAGQNDFNVVPPKWLIDVCDNTENCIVDPTTKKCNYSFEKIVGTESEVYKGCDCKPGFVKPPEHMLGENSKCITLPNKLCQNNQTPYGPSMSFTKDWDFDTCTQIMKCDEGYQCREKNTDYQELCMGPTPHCDAVNKNWTPDKQAGPVSKSNPYKCVTTTHDANPKCGHGACVFEQKNECEASLQGLCLQTCATRFDNVSGTCKNPPVWTGGPPIDFENTFCEWGFQICQHTCMDPEFVPYHGQSASTLKEWPYNLSEQPPGWGWQAASTSVKMFPSYMIMEGAGDLGPPPPISCIPNCFTQKLLDTWNSDLKNASCLNPSPDLANCGVPQG